MKYLLIALTILMTFAEFGCKKGENDPLLSLRTRNNRLKGTWELKFLEQTEKVKGEGMNVAYGPYTVDDLTYKKIEDGIYSKESRDTWNYEGEEPTSIDCTEVFNYYGDIFFHKDGLCIRNRVIDNDTHTVYTNWYWIDREKRKSAIAIGDVIYELDRLSKDELIMTRSVLKPAEKPEDQPLYPESYYVREYTLEYRAELHKVSNEGREPL